MINLKLNIFSKFSIILAVLLLLSGSISYAAQTYVASSSRSFLIFTGWHKTFSNIRTNGDVTESLVPEGYEAAMDLRLAPMISLTSAWGKSLTNDYLYYGGGLRIDLPGFLLFGWKTNDYIKQRKRFPINTSLHGEVLKFEDQLTPGFKTIYLITRGGLQIDISFSRKSSTFLALDISVVNILSDLQLSPGAGLGVEF